MSDTIEHADGRSRERLNAVLNELIDRAALIRSMNDGGRDLDRDCFYPKGFVPRDLYQELYDREPVAARVVEVYPKECWQVQPTIYEDEDPGKETPFEAAWSELSRSIRSETSYHQDPQGSALWEYVSRVDCLSGIGHYGIILLGIDDGKDLSEPADLIAGALPAGTAISSGGGPWSPIPGTPESGTVGEGNGNGKISKTPKDYNEPKGFQGGKRRVWSWNADSANGKAKSAPRKLTFMRVFPESMAWVNLFDSDPKSPRFGQPTQYTLYFNDPTTQSSGIGAQMITAPVHWTRVIHIADNLGSSEVFGVPRMQQVLNRLLDLRKLYGGSAEMYWRGAFPGYSLETLPQLGTDVEIDEDKVKQMMWDWANGLQRYITLTGLSIKGISPQVSDPTNQVNTHIEAICIKLGVPVRIFKGSERGELASSQDDDAWNDRLRQRQNNYITPRIVVPLVDRLISLGVLPQPEGYSVWWPDLEGKTDTEKATVGGQRTTAIVAYAGQPAAQDLITPMDYWTRIQGLTDEEAQTIVENAEEAKAQRQKEAEAQQAQQAKEAELAHQRQLELVKAQTPDQPPPGFSGEQGGDSTGPGAAAGASVGGTADDVTTASDATFNAKLSLTGGQWLTLHGVHVYVKDGKIVAGPSYLKGEGAPSLDKSYRLSDKAKTLSQEATTPEDHAKASAAHADAHRALADYAERPGTKADVRSEVREEAEYHAHKALHHASEAGGLVGVVGPAKAQTVSKEPTADEPPSSAQTNDYRKNGVRAAAFKEWFGDWEKDPANASKVVDKHTGEPKETYGEQPKVLYHGRQATFESFDLSKAKLAAAGLGVYFAENRRIADSFATMGGKKGDVLTAYLSIKKPFNFDTPIPATEVESWARATREMPGAGPRNFTATVRAYQRRDGNPDGTMPGHVAWRALKDAVGDQHVNKVLQRLGYDGIVHTSSDVAGAPRLKAHEPDLGRVWVAFHPTQIKSVDNKGTFSPTSHNIYNESVPPTAPLEHSRLGLLPTVPPPVFIWPHIDTSPQEVRPLENFDPSQVRDDTGKWSKGSGDSAGTTPIQTAPTVPERLGPTRGEEGHNRQVPDFVDSAHVPKDLEEQAARIGQDRGGVLKSIQLYSWEKNADRVPYNSIINEKLRQGRTLDPEEQQIVDHLDKITKEPLAHPLTVYRGVGEKGPQFLEAARHLLAHGGTIEDRGLGSTSLDPHISSSIFTHGESPVFQIEVKRGAYIARHSVSRSEQEFLLPRGNKYRVKGIDENVKIGRRKTHTVIRLEEV